MDREETQIHRAIAIFMVVLIVLLILALYGYLSGTWQEVPV